MVGLVDTNCSFEPNFKIRIQQAGVTYAGSGKTLIKAKHITSHATFDPNDGHAHGSLECFRKRRKYFPSKFRFR